MSQNMRAALWPLSCFEISVLGKLSEAYCTDLTAVVGSNCYITGGTANRVTLSPVKYLDGMVAGTQNVIVVFFASSIDRDIGDAVAVVIALGALVEASEAIIELLIGTTA